MALTARRPAGQQQCLGRFHPGSFDCASPRSKCGFAHRGWHPPRKPFNTSRHSTALENDVSWRDVVELPPARPTSRGSVRTTTPVSGRASTTPRTMTPAFGRASPSLRSETPSSDQRAEVQAPSPQNKHRGHGHSKRFHAFLNSGIGSRYKDLSSSTTSGGWLAENSEHTETLQDSDMLPSPSPSPSQRHSLRPASCLSMSVQSSEVSEAVAGYKADDDANRAPSDLSSPSPLELCSSSGLGVSKHKTVKLRHEDIALRLNLSMEDECERIEELPCSLALSAILRAERADRKYSLWTTPSPRANIDKIRAAWTLATGLEDELDREESPSESPHPSPSSSFKRSFSVSRGSSFVSESGSRPSTVSTLKRLSTSQGLRQSVKLPPNESMEMMAEDLPVPPANKSLARSVASLVTSDEPWDVWECCSHLAQKLMVPVTEVKRSLEVFRSVDRDNSGSLHWEEFAEAIRRRCNLEGDLEIPDRLIELHWNSTNMDDDQVIDFEEFLAWSLQCEWDESLLVPSEKEKEIRKLAKDFLVPLGDVEFVRKVFDSFDEDDSNEIDKTEFKVLFCKLSKQKQADVSDVTLERYWSEADQDGSGNISFEEFLSWWYNIMHGQTWRSQSNALH